MWAKKDLFVPVGHSFVDSGITAVLGVYLEIVYIRLRSAIWRSAKKGNNRIKAAFEEGRLCANISINKLSRITGLSTRTIYRQFNLLERIGWIITTKDKRGHAFLVELGFKDDKGEHYYADRDIDAYTSFIADKAKEDGYYNVNNIPDDEFLDHAHSWFNPSEHRNQTLQDMYRDRPETVPSGPLLHACEASQSQKPCLRVEKTVPQSRENRASEAKPFYFKEEKGLKNKKGQEQEEDKEELRSSLSEPTRSARGLPHTPEPTAQNSGFEPSGLAASEDAGTDQNDRECNPQIGKGIPVNNMEKSSPLDQKQESSETSPCQASAIDIALDNELETEEGVARRNSAQMIMEQAKAKSDSQKEANRKRAERRAIERNNQDRDKQVSDKQKKEQKQKNLKGGTSTTYQKRKEAREVWDIYVELLREYHNGVKVPVPHFEAKGNGKLRGQLYNVIGMYGLDVTKQTVTYMMKHWDQLQERFFGKVSPPNISLLFGMHSTLAPEAAIMNEHLKVIEEVERMIQSGKRFRMGSELNERYNAAKKAVQALI